MFTRLFLSTNIKAIAYSDFIIFNQSCQGMSLYRQRVNHKQIALGCYECKQEMNMERALEKNELLGSDPQITPIHAQNHKITRNTYLHSKIFQSNSFSLDISNDQPEKNYLWPYSLHRDSFDKQLCALKEKGDYSRSRSQLESPRFDVDQLQCLLDVSSFAFGEGQSRCQSTITDLTLTTDIFSSSAGLSEFNLTLKQSDFIFLKGYDKNLLKRLKFITEKWDILEHEYLQPILHFLDLFALKIKPMPYSNDIYKDLSLAVQRLQVRVGYRGKAQNIGDIDIRADVLFQHYVNELKTKNIRKGVYYIRSQNGKPLILHDLINNASEFNNYDKWQSCLNHAKYYHQLQRRAQQKEQIQNQQTNIKHRAIYRLPTIMPLNNLNRLTCFSSNPQLIDYKNQIFISLAGNIKDIDQEEAAQVFLKELVGLLNADGGVVLWDCKKHYLQLRPIGEILLQTEKLQIRREIRKLLQKVTPSIELGPDCALEFIPVTSSLSAGSEQLQFKKGCYVTVLRVYKQCRFRAYSFGGSSECFVKVASVVEPRAVQGNDGFFREKESLCSQFLKLKTERQEKTDIQQQSLRKEMDKLLNAGSLSDQLRGSPYLFLKDWDGLSVPGQIGALWLPPLLRSDRRYRRYSEQIEGLSQRYGNIVAKKIAIVPLEELPETVEKAEGFELVRPRLHALASGQYSSLSSSLREDIAIIAQSCLSESQGTKGEKAEVELKCLLMVLDALEKMVAKSSGELEMVSDLYWLQQLQYYLEGSEEKPLADVEAQYQAKLEYFLEEVAVLRQYREAVISVWGDCHYFKDLEAPSCSPSRGSPLRGFKDFDMTFEGDPEKQFPFASALISERKDIGTIKQKLLLYDIDCEIIPLAGSKGIRGISNSSVIYHKCLHNEISQTMLHNKCFEFDGRAIIVGPLSSYIKLISRNQSNQLTRQRFQKIQGYLQKQYSWQRLKMWRRSLSPKQSEFYLSTDSRASTLFIYLVLKHEGQPVSLSDPPEGKDRVKQIMKSMTLR